MSTPKPAAQLKLGNPDEIEVDFIDHEQRAAICICAQDILDRIEQDLTSPSSCLQTYRDLIWPAVNLKNVSLIKPQLRLVPLERLGVSQGKGGSKVMAGYFADASDSMERRFWSTPMIIKVAEAPKDPGDRDKLREENDNAEVVKHYATNQFVIPFYFGKRSGSQPPCQTLWSRFTPNTTLWDDQKSTYWLGIDDLRHLLEGKSSLQTVSADKIIRGAIALLRPLHSKNLRNPDEENINVVAHYQWYLRGILTKELEWADNSHWSAAWKAVWGTPKQERIELFGMSWTNPFWVLDQLMQRIPRRLQVGVVHGDFHPRNIVLTGYGEPHIIDFGWSGDRHHIAQDFALLECNLRFLVQTPAIPFQDLLTIARWINVEEAPPSNVVNSAASDRVKLICTLRNALPQHFAPTTNWGIQYVVPLFLIGMGLFKHLHECENQVSAHLTVLALGDYIAKRLLPDWPQQPSKI